MPGGRHKTPFLTTRYNSKNIGGRGARTPRPALLRGPCEILQKRTIRIITFFKFDAHTSPLSVAQLKILKMPHVIVIYTACFMFHFSKGNILLNFRQLFSTTNSGYNYNTRFGRARSTFVFNNSN